MRADTFYLGAKPNFIRHTNVPLFVSNSALRGMKTLPRALGPWAEDSAGFTELQLHGRWTRTPAQYIADLRRHRDEIGQMLWAAPQDWMCEDAIIHGGTYGKIHFAGTGLSVTEHQRLTVGNFLDLMALDDTLNIIPAVQGRTPADYEHCIHLYDKAGIRLTDYPVVGIGSVCRIQDTDEATRIVETVTDILGAGRCHGFGFKIEGLRAVGHLLGSADSHAWSKAGRHTPANGCPYRLPLSRGPHQSEANCLQYALRWRGQVLASIAANAARPPARQLDLFAATAA